MTRRKALGVMAGSAGCVLLARSGVAPRHVFAATDPASLDLGDVDRRLRASVQDGTFDGIGLLLCTADGPFYKKAFGEDTTETTHLLASATKYASATAVMTLVDDELVTLDEPIATYLPQFGPVRGKITIRQLLSQTHGMEAGHPSIPSPLQDNGMTLAESVDLIAEDDTVQRPPGSKHSYEPAVSYHICGRIAEVVTGQPWRKLFAERVKNPLEMDTFTYGDTPNPRIGGGAECALQDYGNLLQMHLAGGMFKGRRVLSEASVAEMQKDQIAGLEFTPLRGHESHGYGLAWWFDIVDENDDPVQMSIGGLWGALPWINREHGYAGFQLVQKFYVESSKLYREISGMINSKMA
jgi:CubicO group peptidase (beta-lactamase class C family)